VKKADGTKNLTDRNLPLWEDAAGGGSHGAKQYAINATEKRRPGGEPKQEKRKTPISAVPQE